MDIVLTIHIRFTPKLARQYAEEYDLAWHDGTPDYQAVANHVGMWAEADIKHGPIGERATVDLSRCNYQLP